MHYVRALEDGLWEATFEHQPGVLTPKPPRYLVRCCLPPGQDAVWSVSVGASPVKEGVEVERGLVVGYVRKEDADYMLGGHNPRKELPRAEPVTVVKDMVVCFHEEGDALWACRAGKAIGMTPEEVYALVQQMQEQAQQPAGDGEPEGGDVPPADETTPPADTAKAKGGKGRKGK